MVIWWCIVKGSGYNDWPETFEKTMMRDDNIQGAAWRKDPPYFHVAVATTLPGTVVDEEIAVQTFQ